MGWASGLDYAGVRAYLDECGLHGEERQDVWTGVRACEDAALSAWSEQRSNAKQ